MSFQEYLLDSSQSSLTQAVDAFRKSIVTSNSEELEKSLWKQWRELLHLVAGIPHDKQESPVAFVQELRKQQDPENEDGKRLEIWGEDFRWENLPILGPAVREIWDTTDPSSSSGGDQQKWVNQNAFLAHLTSHSVTAADSLDFSLYGIWALRSAFEDQAGSSLAHPVVLEAASVWILYAGDALRRGSEEGRNWTGLIAREGVKCREEGKDWRGLCLERWSLWKDGILSALEGETTGETRRLLEAASK